MKNILVIEDNTDIRENTAEILTLFHYNVVTAENGKIGVEIATQQKPDLILCDIMMPELDGYGVLRILNTRLDTAKIPFVFVTAKVEYTDIERGKSLGASDYLIKPYDHTALLNVVQNQLGK